MENEDLANAVLDRASEANGKMKLNCTEAFKLAKELEVEIGAIGQVCNQHDIRISKCQLGCFS